MRASVNQMNVKPFIFSLKTTLTITFRAFGRRHYAESPTEMFCSQKTTGCTEHISLDSSENQSQRTKTKFNWNKTCTVRVQYVYMCAWCPVIDWHPSRVYSHLMPGVPGIDSESTMTRTRTKQVLKMNE